MMHEAEFRRMERQTIDELIETGRVYFRHGRRYGIIKKAASDDLRNYVLVEVVESVNGAEQTISYWANWPDFKEGELDCGYFRHAEEALFTYEEIKDRIQKEYFEKMKSLDLLW